MLDLTNTGLVPLSAEESALAHGGSWLGEWLGYLAAFIYYSMPEPGEAGYARGKIG